MQLTGLPDALRALPAFDQLRAELSAARDHRAGVNVLRAARPYFTAALYTATRQPILYVTAKIKRAYDVSEQLPVWLGHDAPVYRFAEPVPTFYQHAPWGDTAVRQRLEALAILSNDAPQSPPLIVTSARALLQKTLPVSSFRRHTARLEAGKSYPLDALLADWLGIGYEPVSLVVEPGTFSRRGGVVDVYPIDADRPIRIDFFDTEIESIRPFDPSTQRSDAHTRLSAVSIPPAREALPAALPPVATHLRPWLDSLPDDSHLRRDAERLATGAAFAHLEYYLPYLTPNPITLLSYAPDNALIVIEDPDELRDTIGEIIAQAEDARAVLLSENALPPDYPAPYVPWQALADELVHRSVVELDNHSPLFAGIFAPAPRFAGQIRLAVSHLHQVRSDDEAAVVVSQQGARLTDLWSEQTTDGYTPLTLDVDAVPDAGAVRFVSGSLQEGWTLNARARLHLITDAELFGWSRPEPRRRKPSRPVRVPESDYADWREGDYVVHIDYGIGQFAGLKHRTLNGIDREYLAVTYGGNDELYVPIHQADRLTRYIGADDKPPALHRLGKPEWETVRNRVKKAVEEDARELLKLYAQRAEAHGYAFAPDDHYQHELEASFPYVETEDQLRAVREVKTDMEKPMPMDRLICGDVGYGKTEVALRAAFKAVNSGKQVVVLVPTTLLAQQHYDTFSNRLAPFPVRIELMSRFRSKEQQERILPKIASGEVDIIIGTHRILSADITLKDLGLVIIDEEQRFGVKQKEHFKKLRTQVDVLTLTATPIPRTLYMSMTGVRDISMIQTPPEERLPIITHVGTFSEELIRQAVLREIERGGQVFVVHNRVRTIDTVRDQLEEIVPEARIVTAHGQMNERQLEGVMSAFARGEYDILLSTAIIETGIDIPNANTLIVDRADWFGLSQLYQLRGRVGRAAQQAYAYFFYHASGRVTDEARQRLETLAENTHLGAGFQISLRDLEIRGAGDILSTRQTGHVSAIGLHLYTQLLTQAVQKLKGKRHGEPAPVVATNSLILNLPVPAYLPSDWISELALRLQIYRRIGSLHTTDEVDAMRAELRDRFGQLPPAVEGLLYQIEVKLLAQSAGATAVTTANDGLIQIRLPYLPQINRDRLAEQLGEGVEVTRTAIELQPGEAWQTRLLEILAALAHTAAGESA